jgi:hypothetical protein
VVGLQLSAVQTLPSLQLSGVPPVHSPAWQVSSPLQTLPSAHDEPFGTDVVRQPAMGSQESVVHTLPSLQLGGLPAVQAPLWHVSSPLHRLPSAHDAPFGRTGLLHTPALQTSVVHGLPSAQSAFTTQEAQPPIGVFWQPLSGWHESVVQALASLQLSAVPAVHTPAWHASAPLQRLPSRHGVPFSTAVWVQPKVGLQLSVVHVLASLQLRTVPAVHTPTWQVSSPLQTLPSVQDEPFRRGVLEQPVTGLQPSAVHTLASLQLRAVPVVQTPP